MTIEELYEYAKKNEAQKYKLVVKKPDESGQPKDTYPEIKNLSIWDDVREVTII